jgi:hypothetical protein
MKKVLGIVVFIFAVFLFVVLIENYGITHTDTKVILIDTCINDTVKIPIDSVIK